jgi:hypothetical protein
MTKLDRFENRTQKNTKESKIASNSARYSFSGSPRVIYEKAEKALTEEFRLSTMRWRWLPICRYFARGQNFYNEADSLASNTWQKEKPR